MDWISKERYRRMDWISRERYLGGVEMKTNEYKKRSLIKVSFSFISRFTDFFNKSKQAELNQQLTKEYNQDWTVVRDERVREMNV